MLLLVLQVFRRQAGFEVLGVGLGPARVGAVAGHGLGPVMLIAKGTLHDRTEGLVERAVALAEDIVALVDCALQQCLLGL